MKHTLITAIVLVLLASAPAPGWGQSVVSPALAPSKALTQYVHEVWQDEEGLPQNSVSAIAQTPDGYLWLGTQEGLVRFNGTTFTVFDKSNTPALAGSHHIRTIAVGSEGQLWVGTFGGGLLRLDGPAFSRPTVTQALAEMTVSAIHEDDDGVLWVGTFGDGLFRIDGTAVARLSVNDGLAGDFITDLFRDHEDALWIGTRDGLTRLAQNRLANFTTADGLAHNFIRTLHEDAKGTLWVSTRGGVNWLKNGALIERAGTEALHDVAVVSIHEDATGSIWLGTEKNGLYRYRDGRLETFSTDSGLTHAYVRALFQDREGSLWIGTDGGGLNRLRQGKFTPFTQREGLNYNIVYSVFEDQQGHLWVGTEGGGLNQLDPATGRFKHYTTAQGLSHDVVSSIYGDPHGTLYVGTFGGGLNRLDPATGRIKHYATEQGLAHDVVSSLFFDTEGLLWIGTDGGLSRFDPATERFRTFTTDEGLSSNYVTVVHRDRHGVLWIGTYDGGLNRYDPADDGRFTAYTTDDGLGSNTVLAIHEDAAGVLWLGTYGGGLSRLTPGVDGSAAIATVTSADGLFNDNVYQILEDDAGRLWMSCNKGIFRVEKASVASVMSGSSAGMVSSVYGISDGLRSREMNGGAQPIGWRGADGRLWFSSVEGVAMVDPAGMWANRVPPPVVLEDVRVDGLPVAPAETAMLRPGKKKIEFTYAALSFIAPEQMKFLVRLDGYDEDWQEGSLSHTATYTNLDPGRYTFRVKARNADGVWSETEATFSFNLQPFFYQTSLFWVLCLLGVFGSVFGGYRWRVNHLKARHRELENLIDARTHDLRTAKEQIEAQADTLRTLNENLEHKVQEQLDIILVERKRYEGELIDARDRAEESAQLKSAILNNMSHELRTPLTAILGYSQILSEEVGSEQQEFVDFIEQSGKRLMDTLNSILDLSRLEVEDVELNRDWVDLNEAAYNVVTLFTPLARQGNVRLHAAVEEREAMTYLDRTAVDRILNNLVNNALKFTEDGEVCVSVATEGDELTLRVRDTGIGIAAEFLPDLFEAFKQESSGLNRTHNGSGLGLTITRRLVHLMGGQIEVESVKGEGSTFIVRLPVTLPQTAAPEDAAPEAPAPPTGPMAWPDRPPVAHAPPTRQHPTAEDAPPPAG